MDLSRTAALIGENNVARLRASCAVVAGLGGVGGYAAEALCRSGIGRLILVDGDCVSPSNLNRQIFAVGCSVGMRKTEAAAARLRDINPECELILRDMFITQENVGEVFDPLPDFVIDAVDTVSAKLALAQAAFERGVDIVSCMGAGNRLDPTAFRVGNLSDTAGCGCGLARVMRREVKKLGLPELRVVYSVENPVQVQGLPCENGRHPPASAGWTVGAAGLALAGEAISRLCRRS